MNKENHAEVAAHVRRIATDVAMAARQSTNTPEPPEYLYDVARYFEDELPALIDVWVQNGRNEEADKRVAEHCMTLLNSGAAAEAFAKMRAGREGAWKELFRQHRNVCFEFINERVGGEFSQKDIEALTARLQTADVARTSEANAHAVTDPAYANREHLKAVTEYQAWRDDPNRKAEDQNRLTWRMGFAYFWPSVLAEWKKEKTAAPTEFAMPPLGATIAPYFGGTKPGTVTPFAGGKFRIDTGKSQMDLLTKSTIEGSDSEVLQQLDMMLGNRAYRFLSACFYATTEDVRAGRSGAGSFWYSSTNMADLLGFAREKNGKSERQSQKHRDEMDALVMELANVKFEGPVSVGGAQKLMKAQGLIVPQNVTLEDFGADKRKGRKPKTLMRISDGLLMLMRDGGAYMLLPREALKPPTGIDQRTWDDAFKVFSVLAEHGRFNAADAKTGKPWVRLLPSLLVAANTASRKQPHRNAMGRLKKKLLPALKAAGLLSYRIDGERLVYTLPAPGGAATLAKIKPKRALPAHATTPIPPTP